MVTNGLSYPMFGSVMGRSSDRPASFKQF